MVTLPASWVQSQTRSSRFIPWSFWASLEHGSREGPHGGLSGRRRCSSTPLRAGMCGAESVTRCLRWGSGTLRNQQVGGPKGIRAKLRVAELLDVPINSVELKKSRLKHGWAEIPEWVFCSEIGGFLDGRNLTRTWHRVRRKGQKEGVRPLRLHDARHTFASLALASGKSVRWVASQLGHANPELTLRVYAHALREEETDLSFLDFGASRSQSGGTRRHPRGTKHRAVVANEKPLRATPRRGSRMLEHETGLEPATPTLARRCWP